MTGDAFSSFNELGSSCGRAVGYVEDDAVGPDAVNVGFGKFVAESGSGVRRTMNRIGEEGKKRGGGGWGGWRGGIQATVHVSFSLPIAAFIIEKNLEAGAREDQIGADDVEVMRAKNSW